MAVKKRLTDQIERNQTELGNGGCKDFIEYRYLVGCIRTCRATLDAFDEEAQKLQEG